MVKRRPQCSKTYVNELSFDLSLTFPLYAMNVRLRSKVSYSLTSPRVLSKCVTDKTNHIFRSKILIYKILRNYFN